MFQWPLYSSSPKPDQAVEEASVCSFPATESSLLLKSELNEMRSVYPAAAASLWATTVAAYGINNGSLYPTLAVANHTCAIQPEYLSCSVLANPLRADSCCVETFGGLVLSTQFWNTWADKAIPQNTWTLHGLWPDFW
jgi:hypothetical protein